MLLRKILHKYRIGFFPKVPVMLIFLNFSYEAAFSVYQGSIWPLELGSLFLSTSSSRELIVSV